MLNIYKNNQFNIIINSFYEIVKNIDISEISEFFSDIEINSDRDLKLMYKKANEIDKKITNKIVRLYIENFVYYTIGIGKNPLYKSIDNKCEIDILEKDKFLYDSVYLDILRSLRYKLGHIFKRYYDVVLWTEDQEELRIMYSTYLSIIYSALNTMPKSYIEKMMENEEFKALSVVEVDIGEANTFYISKIDDHIREYLKEKYGVDVYYIEDYQDILLSK